MEFNIMNKTTKHITTYFVLIITGVFIFTSCDDPVEPDTSAPTVVITSPVEDATLSSATTIRVDATDDTGVDKVEFLIDGQTVATDTEEPWEHLWQVSYYADGETHSILAKATDEAENIGQSDLVHVFVSENAQETPTPISPENGEVIADTDIANLTWSSIAGAEEYIVLVSSNNNFTDTEYSITTSDTTVTTDALADGTHYWKVRAKNSVGNYGGWSSYFTFSIGVSTITDIDGNVYQTVEIGDQVWMAENLKVTHYRNGDAIPTGHSNSEWSNLYDTETGAYCVYDDNEANADTYGYLYNWYAVDDSRNIAPEGWHVPTDDEIKALEMYLGMSQSEADDTGYRGTNEGSKLAGNADLWNSGALENNSEFGSSGFTALPGGYRDFNGSYYDMGLYGTFWSSTEYLSKTAWYRALYFNSSGVYRFGSNKQFGFSVRCIRD